MMKINLWEDKMFFSLKKILLVKLLEGSVKCISEDNKNQSNNFDETKKLYPN